MTGLLAGETALVTGGAAGIGRGICLGLAAHGAEVLIGDIDVTSAREVSSGIVASGGVASGYRLDVSDPDDCARLAAELDGNGVRPSVVVNNAGIMRRGSIDDPGALADFTVTMDVDLVGPFQVTRAFLQPLTERRGAVVNIGSIQCFVHARNSVGYTAAKSGLLGLTKALAAELGPRGIRVNGVAPGMIETGLNRSDLTDNPARREEFLARTPLGRLGTPDDIAAVVAFLGSRMAPWLTGVMVPVDGGYLTT